MPDLVKLENIIDTFTEQDLDLVVPIDFKDADSESLPIIDTYNKYLAAGKYEQAYQYRLDNADILEPLIIDAKKLNIMMAMMINTYLFAKGERDAKNLSYSNTKSKLKSTNLQDVVDELNTLIKALDTFAKSLESTMSTKDAEVKTYAKTYADSLYTQSINRHKFVTKLPSSPDDNTFYYLPEK